MTHIHVGRNAVVSQGAKLCTGTHDIEDKTFKLHVKPIYIHEDAWIAAEAFIGPGVVVGRGAVVGARCVLFSDAEQNGVYVGNPARMIRHRRSAIK